MLSSELSPKADSSPTFTFILRIPHLLAGESPGFVQDPGPLLIMGQISTHSEDKDTPHHVLSSLTARAATAPFKPLRKDFTTKDSSVVNVHKYTNI